MRIVLSVLLLFIVQLSFSQTIIVKDDVSFHPLENVNIFSLDKGYAAVTNAKGQVDISLFHDADSILFKRLGYKSEIFSYTELKEINFHVFLQSDQYNLRTFTVAATRWKNTEVKTPHPIIRMKPEQIAIKNPQTMADFIGNSDLVYIQKSQLGGGSPMIRGFSANRLLISIDGVRMNNAIYRSGNLQNIIALDPFSIETADIILGPGSVIYGSDAIGGVMSFDSRKPKFSADGKPLFMGNFIMRTSSANFERTGHFDLNVGFRKWASLTSISYSAYNDLRMGANGPDEYQRTHYVSAYEGKDSLFANPDQQVQVGTAYSQLNILQKIRYKPNVSWDMSYGVHYSKSSDIPRYDRLIQPGGSGLKNAEWYYGPQEWMMHNLNIQHKDHNLFYNDAQLIVAYQEYEESRHSRKFDNEWLQHRTEHVNIFSTNLDLKKKVTDRQTLYYGVEGILNSISSEAEKESVLDASTAPLSTRYPDGSVWNSFGAYVSYNARVHQKTTIHSGLRYTYVYMQSAFDTTFFPIPYTEATLRNGAVNGSIGLTYEANARSRFTLNASTGFRAPNIDDMAKVFDSEPGMVVVPNSDLKPEYAYNLDMSYKHMFWGRFRLDVGVFYTYLNNALIRRPFELNGQDSIVYDGSLSRVEAIQNADNAFVYGAYAILDYQINERLKLHTAYNYQKGKEEDESGSLVALRHAAPAFGSFHITYKQKRLGIDLYTLYSGSIANKDMPPSEVLKDYIYAKDEEGLPYSPAWYTINLKGVYEVNDFLVVSAGVENITNQRYRTYSSGIVAPGINFIAMVKAKF